MTPDPTWLEIAETAGMGVFAFVLLGLLAKGGSIILERGERREEVSRGFIEEHAKQTELLRIIADTVLNERKEP